MNILLMGMPDVSPGYLPNLGRASNLSLQSLAGNLDKRHNVKIADLVLKRQKVKRAIMQALNKVRPDVIGLTAMTFQYDTAAKIASFIKDLSPGIKIALGGYHATLVYDEIAESKEGEYFDFIFRGESDLSFNEAINKLENGEDLGTVAGLSFKRNGKFIHNKKRELENLDRIKLPARNVKLWGGYNLVGIPFDTIEFSRGCLMSCNFCNIRSMYGKTFRTYDTQRVIKDIENARRSGTRLLFFTDDNITTDMERLEQLCDEIIRNRHHDMIYFTQASSMGIASSERVVEKMAQAGFRYVFLGIENASKENLKFLQKGNIVNHTEQAVRYLKKNGFLVGGGIIVGNPGDNRGRIKETYEFARRLSLDFAGIQFLVPYPKTEIREILLKDDLITNIDNYKTYNGSYSNIKTKYLTEKELNLFKQNLTRKYFKTRNLNALKALMKNKRMALKILKGRLIKMIFLYLISGIAWKIKKLYMNEERIFSHSIRKWERLNEFRL